MKERPRQKIEGADEVPPPLRYPLQGDAPLRRRLRDEEPGRNFGWGRI
jgi:hypothetical protein